MFWFLLIARTLLGQVENLSNDKLNNYDKFNFIDSDIRNITRPTSPTSPTFNRSLLDISTSFNNKKKRKSRGFIYQDIGPQPSLIPVRPHPGYRPENKENQIRRKLYYPPCIYLPEYHFRETIANKR